MDKYSSSQQLFNPVRIRSQRCELEYSVRSMLCAHEKRSVTCLVVALINSFCKEESHTSDLLERNYVFIKKKKKKRVLHPSSRSENKVK